MRVETKRNEEGFAPISLTITIEDALELRLLREAFGYNWTVARLVSDRAGFTNMQNDTLAALLSYIRSSLPEK